MKFSISTSLESERISSIFAEFTDGLKDRVPLKELLNMSIDLSEDIDLYKHCEYQAMIAACILSQKA